MTLKDWLNHKDVTASDFAKKIGRSAPTVSRILRGINKPDWETMLAIEAATEGAVTPNDFREVA